MTAGSVVRKRGMPHTPAWRQMGPLVAAMAAGAFVTSCHNTAARRNHSEARPASQPSETRLEASPQLADACVYCVFESQDPKHSLDLLRRLEPDVLVRAWFKWGEPLPYEQYRWLPSQAHRQGAVFGGGLTWSAVYDGESGLSPAQVDDMATRDPEGRSVRYGSELNCRHGSLSSPAFVEYLYECSRRQIDAGVEYLFMDQIDAGLSEREGYDNHSLRAFRAYLLTECPETKDWGPQDDRWAKQFGVPLGDPTVVPSGSMETFDYRAYLRLRGCQGAPLSRQNPLRRLWLQFRAARDDRVWACLISRLRAYAHAEDRGILISANGFAEGVDLQARGICGPIPLRGDTADLSADEIPEWRALIVRGQAIAGRPAPVVFFHDWGGHPAFPFLDLPVASRELWLRTRAAEIFAAGGCYAFPVLGPFGLDASNDGTLDTILDQIAFYRRHRKLYTQGCFLGSETLHPVAGDLSCAAWCGDSPTTVALHIINRRLRQGQLELREDVVVDVPLDHPPDRVAVISPDWDGEVPGHAEALGYGVRVTMPRLEAYAVALLHYAHPVELSRLTDPHRVYTDQRHRPDLVDEFELRPDGALSHVRYLNAYLKSPFNDADLRRPPTFLVNAPEGAQLLLRVRSVAQGGGRLRYVVDGEAKTSVDLPDLDGESDSDVREYGRVLQFLVPAGPHRLKIENVGAGWVVVDWYEFRGVFAAFAPTPT